MINDKLKKEIIDEIDLVSPYLPKSFHSDLKMMRLKYIYKDISTNDYIKDVKYITAAKSILKNKN